MADKYRSVEHRKVVVELRVKTPGGPDFPKDFKAETLEQQMDRWFRKRMREGGRG